MPRLRLPDLANRPPILRWLLLAALSAAFSAALNALSVPAGLFLGALGAGILVALLGGAVKIPFPLFSFTQSIIGCLIASRISPSALAGMATRWPLFLAMVVSVSAASTLLGWLLARTRTLPGTTAIWGTSPGAALLMTIMSEGHGADSRLVAFMQYMRVLTVTLVATLAGSVWGEHAAVGLAAVVPAGTDFANVGETLAVALAGTLIGRIFRLPSAPMLFPIIVVPFLGYLDLVKLELPLWLLVVAYAVIGWGIGLRFTRAIVRHALGALPGIVGTMMALIALCCGLAWIFSSVAGIDFLTAYLATSPGGIDSVAIISASVGGDVSFVMSVQTMRFFFVTLTAPSLATYVVKRTGMAGCNKKS